MVHKCVLQWLDRNVNLQGTGKYWMVIVFMNCCMVEMDGNFSAQCVYMIGLLAKFVRASNSFKIALMYFGKVWCKSNVFMIWFDWLIALYIFNLLPRNTSFLIVEKTCVREEVSDVKN